MSGVRKLPEDLQIRLLDALVSGEDKRGAKGTDFRVFDAWFKDAPSVFASGLSVPWRQNFPRISKEYEEQEKLETKDDNKVEKKGENRGRADDGKGKQDKDRMARIRSAGEAREEGTRRGPVEERGAFARSKNEGGWIANSGDPRKEENGAQGERKEETERE